MSEIATLSSAAIVQQKLLGRLACPITRGALEVLPLVQSAGAVKEAVLWSPRLGSVVGEIRNFQIDFVRFQSGIDVGTIRARIVEGHLPSYEEQQQVWTAFPPNDALFTYSGDWRPIENMVVTDCETRPTTIRWQIDRPCQIIFGAHPWSGHVDVLVNGEVIHQLDLYEPHTTVPRTVAVKPARPDTPSEVVVHAKGTQSTQSMGQQCLFSGCEIATEKVEPIRFEKKLRVRGASYTNRFREMLAAVPASGLCLDIGGGNRQLDDPRYVNLDYAPYDEPDIVGDALKLPFASDTFEFIYSTGVIEHLKDPNLAGKEIYRVTKPGGKVLIGMAFMQPIHSEGQHFFNGTVWGLEEMLKDFRIDDVFWEGSMSFLIEWMIQCTHVDRLADSRKVQNILETVKEWDKLVTYDRLKYIANGVWLCGTKI